MELDLSDLRPCPACGEPADVEWDGDLKYHACAACGHEFGYTRVTPTTRAVCPAGFPLADAQPAPLLLQIGKRPVDA